MLEKCGCDRVGFASTLVHFEDDDLTVLPVFSVGDSFFAPGARRKTD